jgi:hypothetical protein
MAPEQHEHAFDFWIGEWEVHDPEGTRVGTNSVRPLFGTGAVAEHWRGAGGVEGRSLNAYDAGRGCWHQTWVDSSGGILLLDGGLVDGAMVLDGEDGGVRQRITWTREGDGVRQLWETSVDGVVWETAFDGRYTRLP